MIPSQRHFGLLKLMESVMERDRAKLGAISIEIKAIEDQIADLPTPAPFDLSTGHGSYEVSERHRLWVGQRHNQLSIELANALAKKGEAEAVLRKSFGKFEAFRSVLEKQSAKAAQFKHPAS